MSAKAKKVRDKLRVQKSFWAGSVFSTKAAQV
jgi:hypothetical protein